MHKQRLIILAVAVVLIILSVGMILGYLDNQKRAVVQAANRRIEEMRASQVSVLVAKQDIPKGATIEPEMFAAVAVPKEYVQPQAVTSVDRVAGMIVMAPIAQNEQISMSKLMSPKEATGAGGSLAMMTPVGKRAITISVDNIASVAGMVRPGDYVDVIANIPIPVRTAEGKQEAQSAVIPLFQNVLVLAVGQQLGALPAKEGGSRYKKEDSGEKVEASPLITLALNSREASLLAFVLEQGKVRLVLRSPADSQIDNMMPASWDTLFQYIMPQQAAPAEEQKQAPASDTYVEIYRGLNKDTIPLSK